MKLLSTRSGWIVENYGWSALMGSGALCGLPAFLVLHFIFSKTFLAPNNPLSVEKNP
jgi:hypothetical protein